MFISEAYAAAEPVMEASPALGSTLVQLALILLIFYFLLIRPQQKRVKEHADMVNNLKVGDNVVTNSGIYGTISKIEDNKIALEIASGVIIQIEKMAVSSVTEEPKQKVAKAEPKSKKAKK